MLSFGHAALPHPFPTSSPADAVRQALIRSLYGAHRPELADVVAAADLILNDPSVWLRTEESLRAAWLEETLWAAAVEQGVPLAWIRVLSSGQGREAEA